MQLHQLKPKHKPKKKKRVGRGGKRGAYSGKGLKGQKSRAGRKMVPVVRGLIKKYPKLKGYRHQSLKNDAVVDIGEIDKNFKNSETVNPETLLKKGLVRRIKGRMPKVKILGKGKLTKSLNFENCKMSESVKKICGSKK